MKFIFSDKANLGGVYRILNIANSRIYIGSTCRFKTRAYAHNNTLTKNQHLNKFLQNDYNKCGANSFLFEVIEVIEGSKEDILKREQFYLDQFYDKQKNCYNLVDKAMDNRGGNRNKKAIDPLTDKRCGQQSEEHIAKRSIRIKEAYANNPEFREAAAQRTKDGLWKEHSANIVVTHKDTNESFVIEGSVRQFCLDKGLSYKAFHFMVNGQTKFSNGWYLGTERPQIVSQKGQTRKPLSTHKAKMAASKGVLIILS